MGVWRRTVRTGRPERTALASGVAGLGLAVVSELARALVVMTLPGGRGRPAWAVALFLAVSLTGFGLGVLAIWSAIKAWLREDNLSAPARWGLALGLAAMLFVALTGPCGAQSCPG